MKKLFILLFMVALFSCEKPVVPTPNCKTCMTWVTTYDTLIIETGGLYGTRDGTEILVPTARTESAPYIKVCDEELLKIDGVITRDTIGRQIIVTQTNCD